MKRYRYNKINVSALIVALSIALFSCNEEGDSVGISTKTFFPSFELTGGDLLVVPEGSAFTDPGVLATENGQELAVTSEVVGRFTGFSGSNTIGADPDQYIFTYSAINGEGHSGTDVRNVVRINTGDFASSIEGAYSASTTRSTGEAFANILVLIWETAPGVYEITHGLGGFYGDAGGRNFGDDFLLRGLGVTVNDISTNDFTFSQGQFPTWGNVADIQSMTVDVATRTITYNIRADFGGVWDVVLTQMRIQ